MRRIKVEVTTAADGTATFLTPKFTGVIHSIAYVKADYAAGVDFAITVNGTGEGIWTESNVDASTVRHPRAPTHTQAGAAALYASGGVGVLDYIAVANDQVKIVIAQGGNAKKGSFILAVE